MRDILRTLYIFVASIFTKPKAGVYILNGHFLSRDSNNAPQVFDNLLKKMSKFCRFINIEEANALILSGEAENVDETLIAFTFDDGFDDCYFSLAPILEKYNVNACFFINPGFVDGDDSYISNFTNNIVLTPKKKPMSWQQIQSLHERGFVIGNHTYDHVRLSDETLEKAEAQIVNAKEEIERRLSSKCEFFAWPFGQFQDVNNDIVEISLKHHAYVYSGCDYLKYKSFEGTVFNRRHFEANWQINEMKYFLSKSREM